MNTNIQDVVGKLSTDQLRLLYGLALQLNSAQSPAELAQHALDALCSAIPIQGAAVVRPGIPAVESGDLSNPNLTFAVAFDQERSEEGYLRVYGTDGTDLTISPLIRAAAALIAPAITRAYELAQLRAAEQAREQMINLLVHDIRSPLVATHASIEVTQRLLKGTEIASTVFDTLATGLRSVRSAVELCNDMLEVKRLQSGYRIDRRAFSVSELLDEVCQLLHHVAAQRECSLRSTVRPATLEASGDLRLMRRVIMNLVTNAIRFTPPREAIELDGVRDSDGGVRLMVSDRGPGIAPDDRERMFEPFTQGSGEMNRGTGLGLHFCRQAVMAHGGTIWVESRKGGGCVFVVRLPEG